MRRVTSEAAFRKCPSSPALDLDAEENTGTHSATKHFLLFLLDIFARSVSSTCGESDPRTFELLCHALHRARVLDSLTFLSDYGRYHRKYVAPCGVYLNAIVKGAAVAATAATAVATDDFLQADRSTGSSGSLTPRFNSARARPPPSPLYPPISEVPISRFTSEWDDLGPVGRGGYGAVHRARMKLDGALYAVKKIRLRSSGVPERVLREVKALARLSHANIIRYHTSWLEVVDNTPPLCPPSPSPPSPSPDHDLELASPLAAFTLSPTPASYHPRPMPRVLSVEAGLTEGGADSSQVLTPTEEADALDGDTLGATAAAAMRKHSAGAEVTLYIAMELCECTLQDWLERSGRAVVPLENNALLAQLFSALDYLHSLGMVHRDVKPSNCFLKQDGSRLTLRLGDFGLARDGSCTGPSNSSSSSLSSSVILQQDATTTVTTPVSPMLPSSSGPHSGRLGTRTYAAPEQEIVPPAPYTPAADVYAAGIVLVELYSVWGTRMERSKTLSALRRHELPTAFLARYPREAALASALLSIDPLQRPSASDALRALSDATAAAAVSSATSGPPTPLFRPIDSNRLASSTPD